MAVAYLDHEITACGMPRKALAEELSMTPVTLSKMSTGLQAFGLDTFEKLPLVIQIAWFKRYGRDVLGLRVSEMLPGELTEEFLALVDQLSKVARIARLVGKPRQAKALLRADDEIEGVG